MKVQIALALAFLALAPVAATAETQEEQDACTNDALGICGEFIPDRGQVAACLARNISTISGACRTVMLRYQQPAAAAPVTAPAPIVKRAAVSRPAAASKGPLNIKPKLSGSAKPKHTAARS